MSEIIPGTVFSPWAKPRGMHQAMARYQALKGLKPVGYHRPLADQVLNNITCKCPTCHGTGLHGTYGNIGWRICRTCHGLGEAYRITLDELQALRQQVLDSYPDAAPPGWSPGHPIFCPIQELANGRMIDGCPGATGDPVQGELLPVNEGESRVEFLPWWMCVREEQSLQSVEKAPAKPGFSWLRLWALGKSIWQQLRG